MREGITSLSDAMLEEFTKIRQEFDSNFIDVSREITN